MVAPPETGIALGLADLLRLGELLGVLGGGAIFLVKMGRSFQEMKQGQDRVEQKVDSQQTEMSELKEDIKTLNKLLVDVAIQKQRLDSQDQQLRILDQRYDELRRGVGLITKDQRPNR